MVLLMFWADEIHILAGRNLTSNNKVVTSKICLALLFSFSGSISDFEKIRN